MNFTVGSSFITANISNEQINEILIKNSIPHMTLWEKIKDYFFSTGQKEAFQCLYKLCNPTKNLTSHDVEEIFFRLKELASPGYKEKFCSNHIDSSTTGKLHIKGDDNGDLLCIEQKGELCNYTILDKIFIFDIPLIESPAQESQFGTEKLAITFNNWPKPHLRPNVKWMISESVCISYQGKNITLDYTNLYDKFMREVKKVNKGEGFETWKKEEKTTYLSAVISKEIDNIHTVSGVKISNKDKDLIFDSAYRYIDDENLKLDTSCAQSSIKHCIRTYLNGENKINDFFEKESKEKNKIVSEIVNSISNHIYENIFGEGNGLIEKLISHVHASYLHNSPTS